MQGYNLKSNESEKCIFHCDKDIKNEWDDKLRIFWKSFIDNSYKLPQNSIVPYYSNDKKINDTIQLNSCDKLIFENCTFVGDFFLRYENNKLYNYKKYHLSTVHKNITSFCYSFKKTD